MSPSRTRVGRERSDPSTRSANGEERTRSPWVAALQRIYLPSRLVACPVVGRDESAEFVGVGDCVCGETQTNTNYNEGEYNSYDLGYLVGASKLASAALSPEGEVVRCLPRRGRCIGRNCRSGKGKVE